jgi:bifunctional DNA-binding transcriptional regulator/antitoxin component of YhaV-PrlF toxin-antitoxin module
MDFDYKKHSLERLEEWMNDTLLSSEASPQEIYDVIKKATEENYHYFKHHTERCYELLCLLNGNGKGHLSCDKDDPSPECKESWNDFWEESSMPPWGHSDLEYLGSTISSVSKDKVKSWILPVDDDYNITFPEDLIEQTGWKEGDILEWIDQGDGSFKMVKKESKASWVRGNELSKVKTYQEMIDDGWSMTDDGFWIKEN